MVAMQVFIDDSSIGQPPLYCLAGVLAPAGYWAQFSQAWQAALDRHPAIPYWKTSNAMSGNGEVFGPPFSREDRNAKLRDFMRLLNHRGVFKFAITTRHVDYCAVFGNEKLTKSAWWFLTNLMTIGVATFLEGLESTARVGKLESLDFIFDSQPEQVEAVSEGWQDYYDEAPQGYKRFLARTPIFRDEKEFLPIQAADLLAWYVRRRILANNMIVAPAADMPELDLTCLAHTNMTLERNRSFYDYSLGDQMGRIVGEYWFGKDAKNG